MTAHVAARQAEAFWWALVGGYTAALYAFVFVARPISVFFRERFLLFPVMFLIIAMAAAWTLVYAKRRIESGDVWPLAALAVSVGALAAYLFQMKIIEEAIHFVEYGFLAFVIHRALSCRMNGVQVFVLAAIITCALGWLEEGIQYVAPDRVYDIRDVIFNGTGGLIGLYFTWLIDYGQPGTKAEGA